jgi:hypothetical protein
MFLGAGQTPLERPVDRARSRAAARGRPDAERDVKARPKVAT